jgi:serine/threonine-protein kinase
VDAVHWCEEGHRRFPDDFKFVSCQLWLMTSRAKDPDPKLAWTLADSLDKLTPATDRAFESRKARLAVAAVLARKSVSENVLADSARHVAERARGDTEVDPTRDLAYIEAFVRTLLNDREEAVRLLKQYVSANPDRRADLADESGWWFRGLLDYPPFQELVRAK